MSVRSFDADDLSVFDPELDPEIAAVPAEPHPDPIGSIVFHLGLEPGCRSRGPGGSTRRRPSRTVIEPPADEYDWVTGCRARASTVVVVGGRSPSWVS